MKAARLAVAMLFLALPASAQDTSRAVVGTAAIDGKPVVLLADGLWRYDEAAGDICSDIPELGTYCGNPSDWAVYPTAQIDASHRPRFWSGDVYQAEAIVLTSLDGASAMDMGTVSRIISRRVVGPDGLRPMQFRSEPLEIGDTVWGQTGFSGDGVVSVYSVLFLGPRAIIVETREAGASLFHRAHRAKHEAFVKGLTIDGD